MVKRALTSAKRSSNPGEGNMFYFHGAFTEKKDALKKQADTPGAFIRTAWYRSGPRYAVLTPLRAGEQRNPRVPVVRWKKPISQISDVAKQRRAHHPAFRPKGPKKCAKCGSRKFVVLDHKDGNESNLRRKNLRWLCTSCNTKEGIRKKRLGKGVRVRKYTSQLRPKVGTKVRLTRPIPPPKRKKNGKKPADQRPRLCAHADQNGKGMHILKPGEKCSRGGVQRCEHRDGKQRCTKLTGHSGPHTYGKRNPDNAQQAAKVYQMFHGRAVDGFTEIVQSHGLPAHVVEQLKALVPPEDYAKLGDLVSLLTPEGRIVFQDGERPILATNPEASRLYLIGGSQNIDAMLAQLKAKSDKGLIDLGECHEIEYFTRKKFDQFKPVIYYHEFGEESGKRPRLMYDRKRKQLHLVGGNYKIKNVGIVD